MRRWFRRLRIKIAFTRANRDSGLSGYFRGRNE